MPAARALLAPFVAAALLAFAPSAAAQTSGNSYYLDPSGSDSNPCTSSEPCRTIAHMGDDKYPVVSPGDTVFLRPGTYGAEGAGSSACSSTGVGVTCLKVSGAATAPITYTGIQGEAKPTLLGRYRIRGANVRISRVLVDGPTGNVANRSSACGENVLVEMDANNDRIDHSEIRDSEGNAGIFTSSSASGVSIDHNWIHDNGGFDNASGTCAVRGDQENSGQYKCCNNGQHGIYFRNGSGTVEDNVIEHNWARGVQLYPYAGCVSPCGASAGVQVKHNTVIWNGKAGLQTNTSNSGNVFANNIVAGNAWRGQYGLDYVGGTQPTVTTNQVYANSHTAPPSASGTQYNIDPELAACSGCVTAEPPFANDISVTSSVSGPSGSTRPLAIDRRWTPTEAIEMFPLSQATSAADPSYGPTDGTDYPDAARTAPFDIGAFEYPCFLVLC